MKRIQSCGYCPKPWVMLIALSLLHCTKKISLEDKNLFSIEDDKTIGRVMALEIEKMAPVMSEHDYPEVYRYLHRLRDHLLGTGKVAHARDFEWKISVLHDDAVENAFCAPGGFIFIFTGLLHFLDSEDQLAGVLAHEMAHAANRHYTRQISRTLPSRRISEILLGKSEGMKALTVGLANLKYNRAYETEADELSVHYLCGMNFRADGSADFFRKIAEMPGIPPEWLSTHPSPVKRAEKVLETAAKLNCRGTQTTSSEFKKMIASLPKQ